MRVKAFWFTLHLRLALPVRITMKKFRQYVWCEKTRTVGYQVEKNLYVMDRQTDGIRKHNIALACSAPRGKTLTLVISRGLIVR